MAKDNPLDGIGVQKLRELMKYEERFRDEDIKVKCLELVMLQGLEQDKGMPWNKAGKLFSWVKYGNPEMEIK